MLNVFECVLRLAIQMLECVFLKLFCQIVNITRHYKSPLISKCHVKFEPRRFRPANKQYAHSKQVHGRTALLYLQHSTMQMLTSYYYVKRLFITHNKKTKKITHPKKTRVHSVPLTYSGLECRKHRKVDYVCLIPFHNKNKIK